MSSIKQVPKEIHDEAVKKNVTMKIYYIYLLCQIIEKATKKGAFEASELSSVGVLYDILSGGINTAYDESEKEKREKTSEKTSEKISEVN